MCRPVESIVLLQDTVQWLGRVTQSELLFVVAILLPEKTRDNQEEGPCAHDAYSKVGLHIKLWIHHSEE